MHVSLQASRMFQIVTICLRRTSYWSMKDLYIHCTTTSEVVWTIIVVSTDSYNLVEVEFIALISQPYTVLTGILSNLLVIWKQLWHLSSAVGTNRSIMPMCVHIGCTKLLFRSTIWCWFKIKSTEPKSLAQRLCLLNWFLSLEFKIAHSYTVNWMSPATSLLAHSNVFWFKKDMHVTGKLRTKLRCPSLYTIICAKSSDVLMFLCSCRQSHESMWHCV